MSDSFDEIIKKNRAKEEAQREERQRKAQNLADKTRHGSKHKNVRAGDKSAEKNKKPAQIISITGSVISVTDDEIIAALLDKGFKLSANSLSIWGYKDTNAINMERQLIKEKTILSDKT